MTTVMKKFYEKQFRKSDIFLPIAAHSGEENVCAGIITRSPCLSHFEGTSFNSSFANENKMKISAINNL